MEQTEQATGVAISTEPPFPTPETSSPSERKVKFLTAIRDLQKEGDYLYSNAIDYYPYGSEYKLRSYEPQTGPFESLLGTIPGINIADISKDNLALVRATYEANPGHRMSTFLHREGGGYVAIQVRRPERDLEGHDLLLTEVSLVRVTANNDFAELILRYNEKGVLRTLDLRAGNVENRDTKDELLFGGKGTVVIGTDGKILGVYTGRKTEKEMRKVIKGIPAVDISKLTAALTAKDDLDKPINLQALLRQAAV